AARCYFTLSRTRPNAMSKIGQTEILRVVMPVVQVLVDRRMKSRNQAGTGARARHEVEKRKTVVLDLRKAGRRRVAVRLARMHAARLDVLDVNNHAARQGSDLSFQLGRAPGHREIVPDIDLTAAVEEHMRPGIRGAPVAVEPVYPV